MYSGFSLVSDIAEKKGKPVIFMYMCNIRGSGKSPRGGGKGGGVHIVISINSEGLKFPKGGTNFPRGGGGGQMPPPTHHPK